MIKIICVGKIKEKFYKEAVKEYHKRLSKYFNVEIIELDDCGIDDKTVVLRKEKQLILGKINDKDYVITMEIDGNEFDSICFSKKINDAINNFGNISFIIGGSFGLHEDVKKRSNYKISFSKMTFPHQLFRILLLEQLYRAFKIINNEKYHK